MGAGGYNRGRGEVVFLLKCFKIFELLSNGRHAQTGPAHRQSKQLRSRLAPSMIPRPEAPKAVPASIDQSAPVDYPSCRHQTQQPVPQCPSIIPGLTSPRLAAGRTNQWPIVCLAFAFIHQLVGLIPNFLATIAQLSFRPQAALRS